MTLAQQRVLQDIAAERQRQDQMWGWPQGHSPLEWYSILGEEFGEVGQEVNNITFGRHNSVAALLAHPNYRVELVQLAAVAVAAIEEYDAETR